MAYDPSEAERLFARQRERLDPMRFYEDRKKAAVALRDAVRDAAGAAGYDVGLERGSVVISQLGKGASSLYVEDDKLLLIDRNGRAVGALPIEYDHGLGVFVGTQDETTEPGFPKRKRNAVTVVAEAVLKMIADEAAARTRG